MDLRNIYQYQLGERLGAGGMGEVYKARDTRLNRFVAIKALPSGTSGDVDRRRRFLQEAQAVSALNHPNIITIFDIVDHAGEQYMVVEYVDGKTLQDLIPRGGMPLPDVLEYAIQVAGALCAAHAAGIIHRDLKPANIMIASAGLVKLLDFGLARITDWNMPGEDGTTVTMAPGPLTMQGALMGTVNYMSPEQAEGKYVDARTDIFSFGAVLYEMLTGERAFGGASAVSTLSAVLRDDVKPVHQFVPVTPPEIERIISGCLVKDREKRTQTMAEVSDALVTLKRRLDAGAIPRRRASSGWAIALMLILAAAGASFWIATHRNSPAIRQSPAPQTTAATEGALTNDDIIRMVDAHVAPDVIVTQIASAKTKFDLSPAEVVRLTNAEVPHQVVDAMRDPQAAAKAVATPEPVAIAVPVIEGAVVHLTLAQDVPSDSPEGTILRFKVAEDVRMQGTVVIRSGAPATGDVVDAQKKRFPGLGSKMTFQFLTVEAVDGQKIPLRVAATRKDDGTLKRAVDTGAKKAKEFAAATGTAYLGYIDKATTVSARK